MNTEINKIPTNEYTHTSNEYRFKVAERVEEHNLVGGTAYSLTQREDNLLAYLNINPKISY